MSVMEVDQENNSQRRRTSKERKQCYRELLNKIEDIRESEDLSLQTAVELKLVLQNVNSLDDECPISKRVKHADETLLDSRVLSSASSILVKCLDTVDVAKSTYDPTEFCQNVMEKTKRGEIGFDMIGLLADARRIVPETPNFRFLFGTFDPEAPPEPKPVKVRQRKEAQEKAEKKQLQKVVNAEQEEQGIEETVSFLQRVLQEEFVKNEERPIPYYHYVIDKRSFPNSVENIFYCSFLIRDGKAELNIDGHNNLTIKPVRKRDLKQFRSEHGKNTQIVSSLSMEVWQAMSVKEGYLEQHKRMMKRNK